jgi:hypothetical protein
MSRVAILTGADAAGAAVLARAIASSRPATEINICAVSELHSSAIALSGAIVCPLTLDLPSDLVFPGAKVFEFCRDISVARDLVSEKWGVPSGDGNFWVPVVWTAKGPLYGEVIGGEVQQQSGELSYRQPVHLSDVWRQQLYELAYRLLDFLNAPPATYLMQFGFAGEEIYFDRLWPFPAAPAIASKGVQIPDLFVCHWYCLTGVPIYDLQCL